MAAPTIETEAVHAVLPKPLAAGLLHRRGTRERVRMSKSSWGGQTMEGFLVAAGLLAAWLVLQIWILPRFGVST